MIPFYRRKFLEAAIVGMATSLASVGNPQAKIEKANSAPLPPQPYNTATGNSSGGFHRTKKTQTTAAAKRAAKKQRSKKRRK